MKNALLSILLLSFGTLFSQTTVNSLQALTPYLNDSNVNVKLAPGTYNVTADDVASGRIGQYWSGNEHLNNTFNVFLFEGNNSVYDFEGVTINIETETAQVVGNVDFHEIRVLGNGNIIKNLTVVDDGSVHDAPRFRATNIVLDGRGNRLEDSHFTVKGSYPYGYGDMFGKGARPVIAHNKRSACLIRGESNLVKNCTFICRNYGHGIFFQGAVSPQVDGCYVEGELRSTNEVLAEEGTGSPADDVDFRTVHGFNLKDIVGNYYFSLQEAGVRSYNAGETIIDGVEYDRGVTNASVRNCTVVKMRSGFNIGWASGNKLIENCTSLGCETAYWVGSDTRVINSSGDASVGSLLTEDVSRSNAEIELTLLDDHVTPLSGKLTGVYYAGSDHNVTLHDGTTSFLNHFDIVIGGERLAYRFMTGNGSTNLPLNFDADDINFTNNTSYPIYLGDKSNTIHVATCGDVTDDGANNKITQLSDCENSGPPTACTSYESSITPPSNLESGITYHYYEGDWNSLPDFNSLTAESTGITSAINLNNASSTDYFGLSFEGYINIPTQGEYTFYTTSDDGSALWINGDQVVNNDGLHGSVEKSGTVCLEAGYHEIDVAYFEKTGGNTLSVAYAGPGISKRTLSGLYTKRAGITGDFPDPNKIYYIDAPHHNLRLAATGESENAYTTATSTTGPNVEWRFVDKGNGYWHIQRAAGGSKPRLRTDQSENADMQPTSSNGSWTYYDFSEGAITDTYFLTLPHVNTEFKRLQIDRDGVVKMVGDDRNGTWESFRITEVGSTVAEFTKIEAEDYDAMSGIQTESSTESGDNVGWINNGDWLRFDDIDLTGAQSVDLRIACNFSGGTIEIRTGSTTGNLIGNTSVSNTGGNQNWVTVSTSININNASGVQDVYLVFKGGSGYLFNINWLEFSANGLSSKNLESTNQVLVYPTLIKDIVHIKLNTSQPSAVITIINISGQVVASKNIINNDVNTINLEDLPSGPYIMKITDLEGIKIRKIVKN